MAVSWTPYPNGVSLLTLRNSINVFNTTVVDNITLIEASVTALEASKIAHADVGIINSVLVTPLAKPLTTAYTKIKLVDTININHNNGHITHTLATDSWTINTAGVYKLTYSGSMTAPNGSIVTFNYNISGLHAITTPPEFIGRGTSPVALSNSALLVLGVGAVVYIEAKADSSLSMTAQSGSIVFEKTPY